jgi:hypothetical protein
MTIAQRLGCAASGAQRSLKRTSNDTAPLIEYQTFRAAMPSIVFIKLEYQI